LWQKETIIKPKEIGIIVPWGELVYQKKYLNWKYNENNELVENISTTHYDSLNLLENSFSNKQGTKDLKNIINERVFDYPKPINLIKFLINLINNKNALILDFFAGSGTTGQAVMQMNREDGGNRKFILCTNNENNIAYNITYERLYRIINGIGTKGESFNWIKENLPYSNEKLRVIKIDDSQKIDLSDLDTNKNFDDIINNALNGIKLLDNNYDKNKNPLDIYYDLAALNPLDNK
ncbi:MAG: site-specific DNA-methyltransferase, partial [Ureaplasma sp.]|nr:site-specific DNA-methyltransferase [Ureaplasma sp.]